MKKTILIFSLAAFAFAACNNADKNLSIATKNDSLSYAIGVTIGSNILKDFEQQGMDTVVDLHKMLKGMKDALDTNDVELAVSVEEANAMLNEYFMGLQEKQITEERKKYEPNIEAGVAFLAENGKRQGVVTTASGLQYEILKKGSGAKPVASNVVKTHYHGTFLDGSVFDSSVKRGEPVSFPLNRVIPGWTEVLQLMPTGSKWKVWIPYQLGYGEQGSPPTIPPYSTLVFEIELLEIEK